MEQKSVFISYRRALSKHLARSIYQDLKQNQWDVFLDVNTIDSGDFDRIILNQIGARAHFILLISSGSLVRCANTGDWVLREIEEAVRLNRNIVPIVDEEANFNQEISYLPERLRHIISKKNALPLPHFYFDAAMAMLRTRFLKTPEYIRVLDTPSDELIEIQRRMAVIDSATPTSPIDSALQQASQFTGRQNSDWTPFVTAFPELKIPEMSFCLIPVGRFDMGSNDGYHANELPVHEQVIHEPYWIAQYPVTNAEWKMAVTAGAMKPPYDTGNALKWYHDPAMANMPVVGIDWFMARDFAAWLGCRLPTEIEWEYAARGIESLPYPWGNEWKPEIPVWGKNSNKQPAPVNSRPEGKSWVDAWHMMGNVWEWTSSLYEPYPYQVQDRRERDTGVNNEIARVLRGGAWGGDSFYLRAACRFANPPLLRNDLRGLRCVRS